jgi:hypothetical protein
MRAAPEDPSYFDTDHLDLLPSYTLVADCETEFIDALLGSNSTVPYSGLVAAVNAFLNLPAESVGEYYPGESPTEYLGCPCCDRDLNPNTKRAIGQVALYQPVVKQV